MTTTSSTFLMVILYSLKTSFKFSLLLQIQNCLHYTVIFLICCQHYVRAFVSFHVYKLFNVIENITYLQTKLLAKQLVKYKHSGESCKVFNFTYIRRYYLTQSIAVFSQEYRKMLPNMCNFVKLLYKYLLIIIHRNCNIVIMSNIYFIG